MKRIFSIFNLFTIIFFIHNLLSAQVRDSVRQEEQHHHLHAPTQPQHIMPEAPMGLEYAHIHHPGELMIGFKYMMMNSSGEQQGAKIIGDNEIARLAIVNGALGLAPNAYDYVDRTMLMHMGMLEVMYTPHEYISVMVMGSYIAGTMVMGKILTKFHTHTMTISGFSDMKSAALLKIFSDHSNSLHAHIGINIPLGSVTYDGVLHANEGAERFPYNMQFGSGTWDALLGATYTWTNERITVGIQSSVVLRLMNNVAGWRYGNEYGGSSWISFRLQEWVSASARVHGVYQNAISGSDAKLSINTPSAISTNYGGVKLSTAAGFTFNIPNGILKGLRLGVEYEFPFYQYLNGVQMPMVGTLTAGVQYGFQL